MEYPLRSILDHKEIAQIYRFDQLSSSESQDSDLNTDDEFYVSMKPAPLEYDKIKDKIVIIEPEKCEENCTESGPSQPKKKKKKKKKAKNKIVVSDKQIGEENNIFGDNVSTTSETNSTAYPEWFPPHWEKYVSQTPEGHGKLYCNFMRKLCSSQCAVSPEMLEIFIAIEMQQFCRYLENPTDNQIEYAENIKMSLISNGYNNITSPLDLLHDLQDFNKEFREFEDQERLLLSINTYNPVFEKLTADCREQNTCIAQNASSTSSNNTDTISLNSFTSDCKNSVQNVENVNTMQFLASCRNFSKLQNNPQCIAILKDNESYYYDYPGTNLNRFLHFREQYLCGSLSSNTFKHLTSLIVENENAEKIKESINIHSNEECSLKYFPYNENESTLKANNTDTISLKCITSDNNSLQTVENVDTLQLLVSCENVSELQNNPQCIAILKDNESYYYDYPVTNLNIFLHSREQYLCGSLSSNSFNHLTSWNVENENAERIKESINIHSNEECSLKDFSENESTLKANNTDTTSLKSFTSDNNNSLQTVENVDTMQLLVSCGNVSELQNNPQCIAILKDNKSYYDYSGTNLYNFLNFREYLCGSLPSNKFESLVNLNVENGKENCEESKEAININAEKECDIKDFAISENECTLERNNTDTTISLKSFTSDYSNCLQNVENADTLQLLVSCRNANEVQNNPQHTAILKSNESDHYDLNLNFGEKYFCGSSDKFDSVSLKIENENVEEIKESTNINPNEENNWASKADNEKIYSFKKNASQFFTSCNIM